jgi:hypothetical protein
MKNKTAQLLASADFDYDAFEAEAIEALKSGKPLTGKDGVVTPLIKRILEAALEGEIEAHLKESESPNRRNGKATKTVQSTHIPLGPANSPSPLPPSPHLPRNVPSVLKT